ncbi:hypothetical protein [Amnibacterium kyonggiense]
MGDEAERLARELWSTARSHEQCARVVPDDGLAAEVRRLVRRFAREDGVAVRTARMDDAVVAVRLDAAVWLEDAATMRRKLAAPRRAPGLDGEGQ